MTFTIREAVGEDALEIARVQVESWRTTYKGIVAQSMLDAMSCDVRAKRWEEGLKRSEACTYVAEIEDEIVGFASAGKERQGKYSEHKYEIYAIYLLKEHQGKGIGQALVKAVTETLQLQGESGLIVWALTENPYSSFYEKLGGVQMDHQVLEIAGRKHDEAAFAWGSLMEVKV
ncbi:GNAT family N-acetyltransferase [Jeotgalibacillus marinus]|uniref:GNAT family N-acetyltransferase n=1 Tax=Jeotgalibacillus marinus TaxID=86667 RepID=A0ABV3Q4U9_9BACL